MTKSKTVFAALVAALVLSAGVASAQQPLFSQAPEPLPPYTAAQGPAVTLAPSTVASVTPTNANCKFANRVVKVVPATADELISVTLTPRSDGKLINGPGVVNIRGAVTPERVRAHSSVTGKMGICDGGNRIYLEVEAKNGVVEVPLGRAPGLINLSFINFQGAPTMEADIDGNTAKRIRTR